MTCGAFTDEGPRNARRAPKDIPPMDYNTNRPRLKMPSYGRNVQQMVEECLAVENPDERQDYAERIVEIMATLTQQSLRNNEVKQKLWNHLAYIADYKLNVNFPCEINRL